MDQQVTPGQLRKIWASAREIGWTDERLHAELARVIGVSSLRALTYENASLFIDYLVSEGAPSGRSTAAEPPRPNGPRPENPLELATPNQHRYVDGLLRALGWTRDEPYFLGCLKKATGRTKIRTRREATMAIICLEKLAAQRLSPPSQSHSSPGSGAA